MPQASGRRCDGAAASGGVLGIDHERREPRAAEQMRQLVPGIPVVDVDRDGACNHAAQQRLDVGGRVEHVQPDGLVRREASGDQVLRDLVAAGRQLRVAEPVTVADQRAPVWQRLGDRRAQVGEVDVHVHAGSGHRLDLQVLLESCHAHLAAEAGLLVAAERHVRGVPDTAVDADRAGPDPRRDGAGAARASVPKTAPDRPYGESLAIATRRRRRRAPAPPGPVRRFPRGPPARCCPARR